MSIERDRATARKRRHLRVRRHVRGTAERPRLCLYKSLRHIYAQVVDDDSGRTLAGASTLDPALRDVLKGTGNMDAAKAVGELLAKRALEKGITAVVFDRSGYPYHGKIKQLADTAREAGLAF